VNTRRLPRLGWEVSEVGDGMWGMGGWTGSDEGASALALDRAVALGANFFDTAWAYGEGRSERLRYILAHPAVTTVIPGMRSLANVEANLSVSGRPLSPSQVAALRAFRWNRTPDHRP
jgi:aryl-alcohol dehydrogenase-like predicted oxidoreductase